MGKIMDNIKLEIAKMKSMGDMEVEPSVIHRGLQHQIWINFGLILCLFGVYPDPNIGWLAWGGGVIAMLAAIAFVRRSFEAVIDAK